jgi:NAD(P)-dependent dehydrogenase (short-subunit alcohol dehydrogenase family)
MVFTEEAIADQKRDLPVYATKENIAGGMYIVTGANSGLGFEAAKHYVTLGAAKVIMAVRNVVAGEKAKADIEAATGGVAAGIAEVWPLDLASYESV